jgi:hypothetical protein
MPTTFHVTTINNQDLKIVDHIDIKIGFLGNVMVNKIRDASTVNNDYDFPMLNVSNELDGFGRR